MITSNLAFGYNKEVFAIPGRPKDHKSRGCNHLIQNNKAMLVESAEEQITWASGADSLLPIFDNIMDVSYEKAPVALMDCLFKDNALPEDDIVVLCVEV